MLKIRYFKIKNIFIKFGYSLGDFHLVPDYLEKKINNEIVDFLY